MKTKTQKKTEKSKHKNREQVRITVGLTPLTRSVVLLMPSCPDITESWANPRTICLNSFGTMTCLTSGLPGT